MKHIELCAECGAEPELYVFPEIIGSDLTFSQKIIPRKYFYACDDCFTKNGMINTTSAKIKYFALKKWNRKQKKFSKNFQKSKSWHKKAK